VVGESRPDGALVRRVSGVGGNPERGFLPEDTADSASGEAKAGPGQGLGDPVVATETEKAQGVDELADDVGVAADGRRGANEGAL